MPQALGKGFAEYNTQQTVHDIYSAGKQLFAECFFIAHSANSLPSVKFDTRQKKSGLPSVFPKYTRQRIIVCRVFLKLHSANLFSKEKKIFAGLDWNSSSSDSVR